MIGVLIKKDQNWFVRYQSIKDQTINEIQLHPEDELYCLDSDNGSNFIFDVVKIYLSDETLYRAKLVEKTGVMELSNRDMSIFMDSLENPKDPNSNLREAYENKISNERWDEIYEEYSNENYPPFGGPFTDAVPLIEWLRRNFNPPKRKN